jgi:hypothetical protein
VDAFGLILQFFFFFLQKASLRFALDKKVDLDDYATHHKTAAAVFLSNYFFSLFPHDKE